MLLFNLDFTFRVDSVILGAALFVTSVCIRVYICLYIAGYTRPYINRPMCWNNTNFSILFMLYIILYLQCELQPFCNFQM